MIERSSRADAAGPRRRRRAGVRVATGSWLAVAVMLAAIQVALLVPGSERLGGLPGAGKLDYSHRASQVVEPLSDEYLAQALGLAPPDGGPTATLDGADAIGENGRLTPSTPAPPPVPVAAVHHPPTNDDITTAYRIERVPFTARTDASGARRQPDEPDDCTTAERTVWYRYTPEATARLRAQAIAAGQGASIGVFRGTIGDLRTVGCDASLLNPAVQVAFLAEAGATYCFQVATDAGGQQLSFTLDPQGTTERVSLSETGGDPDSVSFGAVLSGDGRYVAFSSWASNLVPGDTNESLDVFVYDRERRTTERVSVSSTGEQANGNSGSFTPAISADGRYVAFYAFATNLVAGDTNSHTDAFVHDRFTGRTTRVSVSSDGAQGQPPNQASTSIAREVLCKEAGDREPTNQLEDPWVRGNTLLFNSGVQCTWPLRLSFSADGRYVAFETPLAGLDDVPSRPLDDPYHGAFVHDRVTRRTVRVSVGPDGRAWTGSQPSLSADGRYVAMSMRPPSTASTYARPQDVRQVWVRDLTTGTLELVSVSPDGAPADDDADWPTLSADGRYVSFDSAATNLVPGDTNAVWDAFVRDRRDGTTTRVSVSSSGQEGQLESAWSWLSGDGRRVVFHTQSAFGTGLAESYKVFAHDLATGTTTLVSVSSTGEEANDSSGYATISPDGRHVAFGSWASNLTDGDDNSGAVDVYEADHGYQLYGRDVFVHTLGVSPQDA